MSLGKICGIEETYKKPDNWQKHTQIVPRIQHLDGEIKLLSPLGFALRLFAQIDSIKSIVEIGTWDGKGSTRAIICGLLERKNKNCEFWSFEFIKNRAEDAKKLWAPILSEHNIDKNIHFIWGNLFDINIDKLIPMNEVCAFNKIFPQNEYKLEWGIKDEKNNSNGGPYAWDILPDEIDMIVLDGGGRTIYCECHKLLKKNPKIICLDDTRNLKCLELRNEFYFDENWIPIMDDIESFTGRAIFIRKDIYSELF